MNKYIVRKKERERDYRRKKKGERKRKKALLVREGQGTIIPVSEKEGGVGEKLHHLIHIFLLKNPHYRSIQ